MGMLDNLDLTSLLGGSTSSTDLMSMLGPVLSGLGGGQTGAATGPAGLAGLVQAFNGAGLGHIIASWIGTGENLPVSAEQLHQVLGSDRVQQIASSLGLPADGAGASLAKILPTLIDTLSPGGALPT
jgi:uncharacterized protein YidB (DUF937 family)